VCVSVCVCVCVCVCDRYVHQLYILVNGFLRPLRMAASSKKPPICHDDVSSIFLNRCVNCAAEREREREKLRIYKINNEIFFGGKCVFLHCVHTVCSETIMFLHEIFHQGLKARIANWPTLVLGKLLLSLTHQYTQIHTDTHKYTPCASTL